MKLERLSCRRRVELLCDYLDRELPPSRRKLIAAHRSSCRPCRQLLASLNRTVLTLKKLKARTKAPAALKKALRARL